jgi:hypothetical protein
VTALASTLSPSRGGSGGLRWPVILHRTPYGITAADAPDKTDIAKGWLPSPEEPLRGSILRGWRNCSLVPKTRERQLQFRDDNRRGNAAHHSSMGGNCEARGLSCCGRVATKPNRAALDLTAA